MGGLRCSSAHILSSEIVSAIASMENLLKLIIGVLDIDSPFRFSSDYNMYNAGVRSGTTPDSQDQNLQKGYI